MYDVIKYIWTLDDFKAKFTELAVQAEQEIDHENPPIFLRWGRGEFVKKSCWSTKIHIIYKHLFILNIDMIHLRQCHVTTFWLFLRECLLFCRHCIADGGYKIGDCRFNESLMQCIFSNLNCIERSTLNFSVLCHLFAVIRSELFDIDLGLLICWSTMPSSCWTRVSTIWKLCRWQ